MYITLIDEKSDTNWWLTSEFSQWLISQFSPNFLLNSSLFLNEFSPIYSQFILLCSSHSCGYYSECESMWDFRSSPMGTIRGCNLCSWSGLCHVKPWVFGYMGWPESDLFSKHVKNFNPNTTWLLDRSTRHGTFNPFNSQVM